MKTSTKIILWMLPLFVIASTYVYLLVVLNGLNIPWQLVGKPSENISKIIGYNIGADKLYVSTDSEEMYSFRYDTFGSPILLPVEWTKDNTYQIERDPIYGNIPVPNETKFYLKPFKVKDIYQFEIPATESSNINKFALSEDGNLWYWGMGISGLEYAYKVFILVFEIAAYVFALLIYFVIFLIKKVRT